MFKKHFSYSEAKGIIQAVGRFDMTTYEHFGLMVIEAYSGEYAIGFDDEADIAWRLALEDYLENVIFPEMNVDALYFNDEAWIEDAEGDGRGHALSPWNGEEVEASGGYFLFKLSE